MKIEIADITSIKPYENNPRKLSETAIEKVAMSLKEYGFRQPIVVDKDRVIVAGHTRFRASKKLGLKQVPISIIDNLTDEQINAYRIADNRTAEESEWDNELLKMEIKELEAKDFKLDLLGFNDEQLNDILFEEKQGLTDEDEVPEAPEEPISKLGDIWKLGSHRLICGDSTKSEDFDKLMQNEKANVVYTDPPYNINYGNIKHEKFKMRDIKNDSMDKFQYREFCTKFIENLKQRCDGIFYCWGAQGKDGRLLFTILDDYLHNSTTIMWYKDQFTLGRGKYHNQYEPCWFGWNKSGESFIDDRKLVNVWNHKRPKKSDLHPTMKPIELIEIGLTHSTKIDDIVLDCFLGSGSTLIACEKLKRICYGMELDPKYCDVIIKRWENFTGKKAELENGQK
jgi:DNA modification methylase